MDININKYFENELCPSDFSASAAELGNIMDAEELTWYYANEESQDTVLLTTFEQFAAFIEHVEGIGFDFSEDEKPMNGQELNALFIQLISGDIRESIGLDQTPIDWESYEKDCEQGMNSANIFKGTDNNIYYYLGY